MNEKKKQLASSTFENVYKIGVAVKGFDGLVGLIVGTLLVAAPGVLHAILRASVGEAAEHTGRTARFIAEYVARIDVDLVKGSTVFLAIFLVSHGLVKLVLVYCLLKELQRAYPYAIVFLTGFLAYQAYLTVLRPSVGTLLLCLLDIIIIILVWNEWRRLKHGDTSATPSSSDEEK